VLGASPSLFSFGVLVRFWCHAFDDKDSPRCCRHLNVVVVVFSLTFSSIQTLLNYSTTLTARNDPGNGTRWMDALLGRGRMACWLRLGRVGIMTTDYGSTHAGRKEIDLFGLPC
jgi:hypothetical protein